MNYRFGNTDDLDLLAKWNHQLIRDEGHRNSMSIPQLMERMKAWIEGEYTAVIFEIESIPVAYALYKDEVDEVYLRQLFVKWENRRQGIGREAIHILQKQIWSSDKRLTVEVLIANEPAIKFWRSVGYTDYCLTLEIMPDQSKFGGNS